MGSRAAHGNQKARGRDCFYAPRPPQPVSLAYFPTLLVYHSLDGAIAEPREQGVQLARPALDFIAFHPGYLAILLLLLLENTRNQDQIFLP